MRCLTAVISKPLALARNYGTYASPSPAAIVATFPSGVILMTDPVVSSLTAYIDPSNATSTLSGLLILISSFVTLNELQ